MRLTAWLVLVAVIIGTVAGIQGQPTPSQAAPPLQDTPLVIIGGDAVSGRVTEELVNDFNSQNDTNFTFTTDNTKDLTTLCNGEAVLFATSRPITDQLADCPNVVEMMVAIQGAVMIVSEGVDFVECLDVPQVQTIFGSSVTRWNEVNDTYPDRLLSVYVPNLNNNIINMFNGRMLPELTPRTDVLRLENDPVRNINSRQSAIGFISLTEYLSSPRTYKAVGLNTDDATDGCLLPTERNVAEDVYPISRQIYWYISLDNTAARDALMQLVQFTFSDAGRAAIVRAGAWYPPSDIWALSLDNFLSNRAGALLSTFDFSGESFQVRLSWPSQHDLDLALRLPDGQEVRFNNQATGGFFRVADDGNEYCNRVADAPHEVIYALDGVAVDGAYLAIVQQSFGCNAEDVSAEFTLEFIVDGVVVQTVTGEIEGEPATFTQSFDYTQAE